MSPIVILTKNKLQYSIVIEIYFYTKNETTLNEFMQLHLTTVRILYTDK